MENEKVLKWCIHVEETINLTGSLNNTAVIDDEQNVIHLCTECNKILSENGSIELLKLK